MSDENPTLHNNTDSTRAKMAHRSQILFRQPVVDLVVVMLAVPLLVVLGLMLENNLADMWKGDSEARWKVLGLGVALLFISLLVCCYVIHRMGICIWRLHNQDDVLSAGRCANSTQGSTCVGSQLHLMSSAELPPSYDSVVAHDLPPPYSSVDMYSNKRPGDKESHIVTICQPHNPQATDSNS